MNSNRFDSLSKIFARKGTRRAALRGAGVSLATVALGGAVAGRVAAQDAGSTPTSETESLLFIQTFDAGVWTPGSGGAAAGTLTLNGVGPHTVYFADRPGRRTGLESTTYFLADPGVFVADDPPNAALVATAEDGSEAVVLVELLTGSYDPTTGVLTYDASPLSDASSDVLSSFARRQATAEAELSFGPGSLFVDSVPAVFECKGEGEPCKSPRECCTNYCEPAGMSGECG
jgi:hypothetical protein